MNLEREMWTSAKDQEVVYLQWENRSASNVQDLPVEERPELWQTWILWQTCWMGYWVSNEVAVGRKLCIRALGLSYKDTFYLVHDSRIKVHCPFPNQYNNFTPLVIKSIKRIKLINLLILEAHSRDSRNPNNHLGWYWEDQADIWKLSDSSPLYQTNVYQLNKRLFA
jgi:hypothetical protein